MTARLRLLPDLARALRVARGLEGHDKWDPEKLCAHQRRRLLAIVRHAAAHSPYYRERFAGVELSDDVDLAALPTLDKATMLENFDRLTTDPRITLSAVEQHMTELERTDPRTDPKLFGEYRALASGGTSGLRGLFVYGRADWAEVIGGYAHYVDSYLDLAPRLPRRRVATVVPDHPLHISGRFNRTLDVGLHRMLRLDARAPVDDLVEGLNRFQPEYLPTYPSLAALLAERQLAGQLRIAPRVILTTGEVCTAEMGRRIVAAWGQQPFNAYGASETGYIAAECNRHTGLHVFEDQVQIEVVDDEYRPVPAGEPGSRLLVTNLFNRTQPLIRYELDDLLTLSSHPCPCGRPFPLLESVGGRREDVLELPAAAGGTVDVHPVTLHSPLNGLAELSEYRIAYRDGELRVEAVLNGGEERRICAEVESRLAGGLARHGAQTPPIRVESVTEMPRHPGSGKHRTVEA
jgi:phenylacetate-coenzyme A ligase PaaK-like adenylate-forming protein